MKLEWINIFDLLADLKVNYKFLTKEDAKVQLDETLSKGVLFKGSLLEVVSLEYLNPLSKKMGTWYYFKCPKCLKNARKIYVTEGERVACRKCSKIKNKRKISTQADRVFRIQEYACEVLQGKVSPKRKKSLIDNIVSHYDKLDSSYKLAYNNFVFRSLQDWCLENLRDDSLEKPYRDAMKDVLQKLRDSKKILVKSGMSISRNEDYGI